MKKTSIIIFLFSFLILVGTNSVLAQSQGNAISIGQRSDEVKDIQEVLKTDKTVYPEGLVTGYFGQATQRAVTKIQAKCGLPQTGVIDENTTKCIFPVNYQVTVISPNGGETWDRSQIQTIKWNAVAISPAMETETKTMPFWSKASIDLFRKSTVECQTGPGGQTICPLLYPLPTFVKHIAIVGIFDGSYSWKITNDIPNGSDYVIRISVGTNIVPLYRYEKEGVSFPPLEIWPSPSGNWDESDNSFTITGSVVPPSTDLSKVIEILQQISDQLAKAIQLLREMNQAQ